MDFKIKENYTMGDLIHIVELLRDPVGGCPWDKEQTHRSIRKNMIEETYEVCDAIDQNDSGMLCEELGDVLLQVALHSQMEAETGAFGFDDVCDGICKKLIYRHPHIFGSVKADTTQQVLHNWEELKKKEKGQRSAADSIGAVPAALPALMRSQKVQKRAAEYGFAYPDVQSALSDLQSEVSELSEALADGTNPEEEIGDVLFSAVNVARLMGLDAEESLGASCAKFTARVLRCEALAAAAGTSLKSLSADRLDKLWKQAKAELQG